MRVRHERPLSDLCYSVRAPLKLTLENGKVVTVDEWSLNGITYPERADILPKQGHLAIPFQGVDIQFAVKFSDGPEKGQLTFEDLTGRQRETLAIFYRSILSGKMASSEDVITSLDTPVDLVPMGETEDEEAAGKAKQSPRLLRVLWNIVFYIIFAAVIFGLIGGQIFKRLSYVPLQHARVVAPIVELHSAQPSFVDKILVEVGQHVRRGDVLITLSDPGGEAAIDDIREDVSIYEELAAEAESRLLAHREERIANGAALRWAFLKSVSETDHPDFAAERDLGEVSQSWAAWTQFKADNERQLGPYFDEDRRLQFEADEFRTRWSRLKRDLGNAKEAMSASDVVATSDGIVTSVDVFEDQFIDRGAIAVTLEENEPRVVQAWLNEARSTSIHIGMPTTIRFNDGPTSRTIQGEILDITAAVDPDITDEFGLIISAGIPDRDVAEARSLFRTNAPVQLRAQKGWFDRFFKGED